MSLVRCDVVIPMFTGLPKDVVVNSFHFEIADISDRPGTASSMSLLLSAFYNTAYGAAANRATYLKWVDTKVRCWFLEDPITRVSTDASMTIVAGGSPSVIPTEVAAVASFESAGLPGEIYQRRYNRVFLGGLGSNLLQGSTGSAFPVLTNTFVTQMNTAMKDLQDSAPGPSTQWVQVSRAAGSPRSLPVIGGWTDNSPDTQRRRSVDATARVVWTPDEP